MTIIPGTVPQREFHQFLLSAIGPRPIAFASTLDSAGNPNLAPFSFFNVFGSNPGILVFSPAFSGRTGKPKDTLLNIQETMEVVINVVSYSIVEQASLASCEFPKGTNEFIKAGFTPIASEKIKPFRVKESPASFECKVLQIIQTGEQGGAGNLIICEILAMHIDEAVLNTEGKIDAEKIDLVARMGGDLYCRASGAAIFTVEKPNQKLGIGFDNLPAHFIASHILSANDLARLANLSIEEVPTPNDIEKERQSDYAKALLQEYHNFPDEFKNRLHLEASGMLAQGRVRDAWMLMEIQGN